MLKKRLIFTLIYANGFFTLSRNFRLQKVGGTDWLRRHYNFSNIASSIDELIVLDASRSATDTPAFCKAALDVAEGCFVPLTLGGNIRRRDQAQTMMRSGADKIVVNTIIYDDPELVREIVDIYGKQSVIASIDYKAEGSSFVPYCNNGETRIDSTIREAALRAKELGVGEIYLNSMDRDGTGQGYCFEALNSLEEDVDLPIILAGGAGNYHHLEEGIKLPQVDAVATANLFNFIGDGLPNARIRLLDAGVPLARW